MLFFFNKIDSIINAYCLNVALQFQYTTQASTFNFLIHSSAYMVFFLFCVFFVFFYKLPHEKKNQVANKKKYFAFYLFH